MSRPQPFGVRRSLRPLSLLSLLVLPLHPTILAAGLPEDQVVTLPPMLVAGKLHSRPWIHGKGSGYEVLSRCSEEITEAFVMRHERLKQLFSRIVPPDLQVQYTAPVAIILSPESATPSLSRDTVAHRLTGGRPQSTPSEANTSIVQYMPNLRITDSDTYSIFAIIDERNFNAASLTLTTDSVYSALDKRVPALPRWVIGGVRTLFEQAAFGDEDLHFDHFRFKGFGGSGSPQADVLQPKPCIQTTEFLNAEFVMAGSEPSDSRQALLLSQAALFFRWSNDPDFGGSPRKYWDFARRFLQTPEGDREALFRSLYGFGYADLRDILSDYLPFAANSSLKLRFNGIPYSRPPELRPADTADIARIKGDWERREISYVQTRHPNYAEQYRVEARKTFRLAREASADTQDFLAAMALCELETGDKAEALRLLEAATQRNSTLRPRAYIELSRLRLQAAMQNPEAANGQLSPRQVNIALTPLVFARRQSPPVVDTYLLGATGWAHAYVSLDAAQFAFLDEGLANFPDHLELLYRYAILYLNLGDRPKALSLVTKALALSRSELTRGHLLRLKQLIDTPHQP